MQKGKLIYEGKGKKLYECEKSGLLISEFKDDLTAFNAEKRGSEAGKGELNCKISTALFKLLEQNGIKTHFVQELSQNTMLVRRVSIVPIEVVVRNIATGSLSKRLGIAEKTPLPFTLVEFYYKDDALGDPLINDEHALILNCAKNLETLDSLRDLGRKVNEILRPFFAERGMELVDFKLEFGISADNELLLADEITPDSCRLWDKKTNEKLDKDRFRQDIGAVKPAYERVLAAILS